MTPSSGASACRRYLCEIQSPERGIHQKWPQHFSLCPLRSATLKPRVRAAGPNALELLWTPRLAGNYTVTTRVHAWRDECWGNPRGGGNFLGARRDRGSVGWYVPECEDATLVPGGSGVLVVSDAATDDTAPFAREQQARRGDGTCASVEPLPQCRSGDTAGGIWVARVSGRPTCGAFTGDPEGRFAGLALVDVANRDLAKEREANARREVLWKANGATRDAWRYAMPFCAYHYFEDSAALAAALAEEASVVLFVGDSTIRLLYVAFSEWLGSTATDTDLYLHPDGANATFDAATGVHVGYLQMWSEDQYRQLVLPPLRAKWAAIAKQATRPTVIVANFGAVHSLDGTCDGSYAALVRAVVDGFKAVLPRTRVRLILTSAPCALGLRQSNFRTGKALETLSIAHQVAAQTLPANFTAEVLDLTNATAGVCVDTSGLSPTPSTTQNVPIMLSLVDIHAGDRRTLRLDFRRNSLLWHRSRGTGPCARQHARETSREK